MIDNAVKKWLQVFQKVSRILTSRTTTDNISISHSLLQLWLFQGQYQGQAAWHSHRGVCRNCGHQTTQDAEQPPSAHAHIRLLSAEQRHHDGKHSECSAQVGDEMFWVQQSLCYDRLSLFAGQLHKRRMWS